MIQNKKQKICLIFGTRPEIIKLSPIIRYLQKNKRDYILLHTAQHYSYSMDKVFFDELKLPLPKYHLNYSKNKQNKSQIEQITLMMNGVEKILLREKPDICLVQGDTNTVLAGSLVTNRLSLIKGKAGLNIKLGHVEAGLRSFDREMPEEVNRIIADNVADYLFVPSKHSKKLLQKENVPNKKIVLTGNTVVDAVQQNLELAKKQSDILKTLSLTKATYAVLTLHRPENVDQAHVLKSIFKGLEAVLKRTDLQIIFPIHPRTKKQIKEFGVAVPKQLRLVRPLGYLDFLMLEANARILLTDSGGIQEEASIMHVPCVTIRSTTERPETVLAGVNILCGSNPKRIANGVQTMMNAKLKWRNLYGDGHSAQRIIDFTEAQFAKSERHA